MKFSTKQLMINKANAQMIIMIGVASVVIVFSLVATRALLSQRSYQGRVITEKEKAVKQLKSNVGSVKTLVSAYNKFEDQSVNIIGGISTGNGNRDGDNAKIILDALPSQYDFPALATSIEKLTLDQGNKFEAITGSDDQLAQQDPAASTSPDAVDMPFEVKVTGTYSTIQNLIGQFQASIRPIQISTMELSGKDSAMKMDMNAQSFYKPAKSLTINTTVIK